MLQVRYSGLFRILHLHAKDDVLLEPDAHVQYYTALYAGLSNPSISPESEI